MMEDRNQSSPASDGQMVSPAPQMYQPPLQNNKTVVAAVLFNIFLGGFGIDRFYLGYVGMGILKMCLMVIMPLILIIVGLIVLAGHYVDIEDGGDGNSTLFVIGWCMVGFGFLSGVAGTILNIVDVIRIATGSLKDSKGRPLLRG